MITVAVISEYNPFHSGHEYHINKIREEFGNDTAIIAIMSGNFTQRGDIACIDKLDRARCAVEGGIDLVLEIPFPYSASSAEFFAASGVKIADSLKVVDYLSFGSESGNIQELIAAAKIFCSDEYKEAFDNISLDKTLGYPQICEKAFKSICQGSGIEFTPNNILAIEYIKALTLQKSAIVPHTVKRCGASYDETCILEQKHQSAMAIRKFMTYDANSALEYLPKSSKAIVSSLLTKGDAPTDIQKLSPAIISYFRLNPPKQNEDFHDAADGLYNRLYNASFKANDITSLLEYTETKKFTNARLKRAMWNIFFGVTSSDVKMLPLYTQVLAMNKTGMLLLKNSTKSDSFSILTKPSDYGHFNPDQKRQKELADRADSIFDLCKPNPKSGKAALTLTPYIKK